MEAFKLNSQESHWEHTYRYQCLGQNQYVARVFLGPTARGHVLWFFPVQGGAIIPYQLCSLGCISIIRHLTKNPKFQLIETRRLTFLIANDAWSKPPETPSQRNFLPYPWVMRPRNTGFYCSFSDTCFKMIHHLVLSKCSLDSRTCFLWENEGILILFHNCSKSYCTYTAFWIWCRKIFKTQPSVKREKRSALSASLLSTRMMWIEPTCAFWLAYCRFYVSK